MSEQDHLLPNLHHDEIKSDASPKKRCLAYWKCLHPILLPLEICVFIYLFIVYFQIQVYQQYYFQRIMKEQIKNYLNSTDLNISDSCLKQDLVVNLTDNETFIDGQRKVNQISMITTLTSLTPSILTSLILTPLSDHYGRKPILVLVLIGLLIGSVIVAFIVHFQLSMYVFLASSLASAMGGGFGVMLACSFAYITDMTPKRWLTIRMGALEASIFVAVATASAAADKWMDKANCDFRPLSWFIVMLCVVGLVYCFLIPESITEQIKISNNVSSKRGWRTFIHGVKIVSLPKYIGLSGVWKLWMAIFIMVLAIISEIGIIEIQGYFLHNKPLEWTYDTIANYNIVTSTSHLLALVVLVPIFVVLNTPNAVIILIGIVFSCGVSVFIALLTKTWEMFLGNLNYYVFYIGYIFSWGSHRSSSSNSTSFEIHHWTVSK